MQTSVYDVLRDAEAAFITAVQVQEWLNRGYLDLNARLRLNQQSDTGTTESDGTIPLPDEFVEAISLWIGTTPVAFTDDSTFESYSMPASLTPAAVLGRVFGTNIETYPAQTSADYTLNYVKRPTEMSSGSSQPTILTPELADRLIDYARAEAKLKEAEYNDYQFYRDRYEEGLPARPRVDKRMKPGPMILIPEAGPFG